MKFCIIFLALTSFNSFASTSTFECKFLSYNLELEAKGFDHIIHELKVNGNIVVTELLDGSWFIEEVNCKKSGFEIVASHAQYNDKTKKVFMLTYSDKQGYKIETGI
ncbi:hypothetical protein [Colwellia sp. MB02u-14]|jgi:hypothetical protein|uniref:hypothetical protein n=1 Tax=Colwellia sp. MB02u-14 TaxID=2759815 RepID=UPI0015F772A5|nr:hypothetical protein [Colwellia sp. MB02u-14]MBA6302363.1 hypothetical protein [Colwellia sp. MB02u-14]